MAHKQGLKCEKIVYFEEKQGGSRALSAFHIYNCLRQKLPYAKSVECSISLPRKGEIGKILKFPTSYAVP